MLKRTFTKTARGILSELSEVVVKLLNDSKVKSANIFNNEL